MIEDAYPLVWPVGVPRTPRDERRRAQFSRRETVHHRYSDGSTSSWAQKKTLTIAEALRRLDEEIRAFTPYRRSWRIDPERVVVSTNLRVRRSDGLPASGQKEPDDPGAAVYFELDGEKRCIASDKWDRVADNIAGIAAAIGALRGLERWVNDANVRAAFKGFAALPDPNRVDWRAIFGLKNGDATAECVRERYRQLAFERHPDRGGSEAAMTELNQAREQALAELGEQR